MKFPKFFAFCINLSTFSFPIFDKQLISEKRVDVGDVQKIIISIVMMNLRSIDWLIGNLIETFAIMITQFVLCKKQH